MSIRTVLAGGICALALATPSWAATQGTVQTDLLNVQVDPVVGGLVHPWGMAFLPDGRFLVTERNPGTLRIGTPDGQLSQPVAGVPEIFRFPGETGRSQGGLFDVKLHPQFAQNGWVYLSLSEPTERGASTSIVRGRLVEDQQGARLENVESIFRMNEDDQDSSGLHFGGRMAFHPSDGTLFLSIGERRNISRSQDPEDQAGSIIRIRDDGSVPPDNPFAAQGDQRDDKIFATGLRNVQGLAVHPQTGELWAVDHGPEGGDEIHRVEAGRNYGWPWLTSGVDYSGAPMGVGTQRQGMESAIHNFQETVAPSGLAFYQGDLFPQWQGDMLIGGLAGESLVRMTMNGTQVEGEEWMLNGLERRIRDVQVAADGSIWVVTEHEDGEVLRLSPAPAPIAETPPQ